MIHGHRSYTQFSTTLTDMTRRGRGRQWTSPTHSIMTRYAFVMRIRNVRASGAWVARSSSDTPRCQDRRGSHSLRSGGFPCGRLRLALL